jgi:hypothetical protein
VHLWPANALAASAGERWGPKVYWDPLSLIAFLTGFGKLCSDARSEQHGASDDAPELH